MRRNSRLEGAINYENDDNDDDDDDNDDDYNNYDDANFRQI